MDSELCVNQKKTPPEWQGFGKVWFVVFKD